VAAAAGVTAFRPPTALQAFMQANGFAPHAAPARHADSVAQASAIPARDSATTAAATDSAKPAGGSDSLSPVDAGFALRAAAMHTAGDSSDAGHQAVLQTAEAAAQEIFANVTRATGEIHTGQLEGAGKDLQVAFQEYQIFRADHASAPQMDSIKVRLQAAMDDALRTCGLVRDSLDARPGRKIKCQHPAKDGVLVIELDDGPARRVPASAPVTTPTSGATGSPSPSP
jgi:hypothetical protein